MKISRYIGTYKGVYDRIFFLDSDKMPVPANEVVSVQLLAVTTVPQVSGLRIGGVLWQNKAGIKL